MFSNVVEIPCAAIVTGSSRGIGRAIALAIARLGAPVVINYLGRAEAAEAAVAEIENAGGRAIAINADIAEPSGTERLVEEAQSAFGKIGLLVNNAGVAIRREMFSNTIEDFDTTFAVNVRAAYALTQLVLPDMRELKWGRLIYLSSSAARNGGVISAPYAASKAALEGLMHYYAAYGAPYGITANAIAPAFIATDMIAGSSLPPHIPIKRFGAPEDIVTVAETMIACSYMTGQTIQVNGGVYMT